jgi:hypothetical protein
MALFQDSQNTQANESISKFKLLSSYGGAGSIIHTSYGSILISCIEEWGFIRRIEDIDREVRTEGKDRTEQEVMEYVIEQARMDKNGNIGISNDGRFLKALMDRKEMPQLKYLALIPDIEVKDFSNKIKDDKDALAINSTFFPKVFSNKSDIYRSYNEWYNDYTSKVPADRYAQHFFPPKSVSGHYVEPLVQDNIVLICEHGHISDFPWSRFLQWRTGQDNTGEKKAPKNLFNMQPCCGTLDKPTSVITIKSNTANASGFDGKRIKCLNCEKQASLQGLMNIKIKCPGHRPWEATTGDMKYHSGDKNARSQEPPREECHCKTPMKVALTTGNNLYYSRPFSSIYIPEELLMDSDEIRIKEIEKQLDKASQDRDWDTAKRLDDEIKQIRSNQVVDELPLQLSDSEKEIRYRFDEFRTFTSNIESSLSTMTSEHLQLKVKDVTMNLDEATKGYFSKILRIDNMKLTAAQLDFSRVVPLDSDAMNSSAKNIFRSRPDNVKIYPVVENYGEGIFFSFNQDMLENYGIGENNIRLLNERLDVLSRRSDDFSKGAIDYALNNNWQMYLVHTFSHLIMKELEFRCGYPTASLSERIYVSNDEKHIMYGCLIYTAEGAEGSMGGLIAQSSKNNLNKLITNSLRRATVCHSDPLCWESEGQGLFDLNFASCFSCCLVSETSCEHRNIYLDRRILVDPELGFFKDVIS